MGIMQGNSLERIPVHHRASFVSLCPLIYCICGLDDESETLGQ